MITNENKEPATKLVAGFFISVKKMITMKFYFTLIVFLLSGPLIFGQKQCKRMKVHSYVRNSMPGNFPKGEAMENGGNVDKPIRPVSSYLIYIENPSKKAKVHTVWLDGTAYIAELEKIEQKPVIIAGGQVGKFQKNDTILQRPKGNVYRVHMKEISKEPINNKLQELSRNNPVVIEFTIGKRKYYNVSREWKKLQPVVLQ